MLTADQQDGERLPQEDAQYTALDDRELRNWLMELIEGRSPDFLSALAEAVVKASPADYGLIRPALLLFRRKYRSLEKDSEIKAEAGAAPMARLKTGSRWKTRGEFLELKPTGPRR